MTAGTLFGAVCRIFNLGKLGKRLLRGLCKRVPETAKMGVWRCPRNVARWGGMGGRHGFRKEQYIRFWRQGGGENVYEVEGWEVDR